MRKGFCALSLLLLLVGFLAGIWYSNRAQDTSAATTAGRRILYYHDPMHPAYKSDKPGIAPDCGMQLEAVYADAPALPGLAVPPGTVQVDPERQRLIGVQVARAERSAGPDRLRTVGRVTLDENRIHRIVAGTDGWVRDLIGGYTGSVVDKDQVLARVYNRDILGAEQALMFALNAMDRFKKEKLDSPEQVEASAAQIRAAEDNLRALGMGDLQIEEIKASRKIAREVAVRAPVRGLVLARNINPALRFERGSELYRLADLSRVWVLADLFENEAQHFRPGAAARVSLPHRDKTFKARVSEAPPQFDPNTRTLKVRMELDNPEEILRPDMFVDVELPVQMAAAISVPADAVIDSGRRKLVYVDRGEGSFEPRAVETGWRFANRVAIVRGLQAGERVVVAGSFLLDSESRVKLAALERGPVPAKAIDPVCGMEVDPAKAQKAEYGGATYYFCSRECKGNFEREPQKYTRKKQGA